jgi:hypothetical protein
MARLLFGLMPILFGLSLAAWAQNIQPTIVAASGIPIAASGVPATMVLDLNAEPPLVTKQLTIKQISKRDSLRLRGTSTEDGITLGVRRDELITHAVFHLHYTFSPSLIPNESHLKVFVNDELVQVVPAIKETLGQNLTQDIEIDPRLFSNQTNIKFEFVGHYTHDCEDGFHSSVWLEINGDSPLELTVRPLALKNDISLLPEPFFNPRDFNNQVVVPFVFSAAPSKETLNAAGIVSSWFGQLAAWRGARFPTSLDELPRGHAVVFVTNEDRPAFLKELPTIAGPSLEMIENPADRRSRLLLIKGRNGQEQKIAAQSLVLGNAILSGSQVAIQSVKHEPLRQAYDAPLWVRLDRPMKFGELVRNPQDLQVQSYSPQPIRIPVRVAPDLFTWRSGGIPIDLKYRYTPPHHVNESRFRFSVNEELVKSFALFPAAVQETNRVRLPLIRELLLEQPGELMLPSFKLGAKNEMQFQFSIVPEKEGLCRDARIDNVSGQNIRNMIDADSTIDFTGFAHYAEMPNLNFFANAGFPFTKFADLSQTVVVMPDRPSVSDIETLLNAMGRMGEATGYPATQFSIANAGEGERLKNVDLLIIGSSINQGLLAQWAGSLPISVSDGTMRNSQSKRGDSAWLAFFGFETQAPSAVFTQQQLDQNGSVAAILGFESPLSPKRSVVALVSNRPEGMATIFDALEKFTADIHGSVSFIHPTKAESFLVGDTYFIGNLPWMTAVWYRMANHPVMLALFALFSILVFAFALWRTFKLIAAKRLRH